jgi:hypothetical protein
MRAPTMSASDATQLFRREKLRAESSQQRKERLRIEQETREFVARLTAFPLWKAGKKKGAE